MRARRCSLRGNLVALAAGPTSPESHMPDMCQRPGNGDFPGPCPLLDQPTKILRLSAVSCSYFISSHAWRMCERSSSAGWPLMPRASGQATTRGAIIRTAMHARSLAWLGVGAVLAVGVMLGIWRPWDGGGAAENADHVEATATMTPSVTFTPSPTLQPAISMPLPDRMDCDQMRGTPYRSQTERQWFLAHCVTPVAPPPAPVEPDQPPPVPQQDQANPPTSNQPPPPPPPQQQVDCGEAVAAVAAYQASIDLAKTLGIDTSALIQARDYWQGIVDQYC